LYRGLVTSCCRAGPCEPMFTPRVARRSLDRYRRKGLGKLERRMVASALAGGIEGARVLEIGGGLGTIQHELLERGADQGAVVELVAAWEPYARELARDGGLETRTSFHVADVLDRPDAVEPADVVVLNRVVCCSPDGVTLAATAARLTRRTLVLSFPRDAIWTRSALGVLNAGMALRRRPFRVFVHPPAALVAVAQAEGLEVVDDERSLVWQFVALRRAA
jgi:hypothetical protein